MNYHRFSNFKVNIDLSEKETKMSYKAFTMFEITTKVLIIETSLSLKSVNLKNNLKKGNFFDNTYRKSLLLIFLATNIEKAL